MSPAYINMLNYFIIKNLLFDHPDEVVMKSLFNTVTTGIITEVVDRASDFHVTYKTSEGTKKSFSIDKTETKRGAFIAASLGHSVAVSTDRVSNEIRKVKIDRATVLSC